MVKLICVFILLLTACCQAQEPFQTKIKSDHIRIDQVGPRDYMLESVIITKEKVELRFPERPVQVDQNVLDSLSSYIGRISKENPSILLGKIDVNEFGIFKVTIRFKDKTRTFFTRNRKMALVFLTGFRDQLKNVTAPEELVTKTENMLWRVRD